MKNENKVKTYSYKETFYLNDYKRYFNEEVKVNYKEGIKINLSKRNNQVIVNDNEGNKVIVNVIR